VPAAAATPGGASAAAARRPVRHPLLVWVLGVRVDPQPS
jgi:hypothetical protein